nr:MAG TPA: hypothetical protein [Caudoviricetes sp.]
MFFVIGFTGCCESFEWTFKPPLEHCSVEVNTVSAAVLLDNVNTTTVIVICQYFFEKKFYLHVYKSPQSRINTGKIA